MMSSRLPLLALAAFTTLLGACAATPEGDDFDGDTEVSEEDLTKVCALGTSCKKQKLLSAKLYAGENRASARRRSDIRVDVGHPSFEPVPLVFAQKTTGTFTFAGNGTVLVSGSGAAAAPFQVDDFLLVEVLGQDGSLLAAGHFGAQAPVHVGAVSSSQLATHDATYSIPATDISSLLPRDRPFRLRFTALDYSVRGLVSDVHLLAADAAPAPPPSVKLNIFDDAAFAGAPLRRNDALGLFAPATSRADLGNFVMAQRTRECNKLTGCNAWNATTQVSHLDVYPLYGGTTPLAKSGVPRGVVTGKTWLEIKNNVILFGLKSDQAVMTMNDCVTDGSKSCRLSTTAEECFFQSTSSGRPAQRCETKVRTLQAPNGSSVNLWVTVSGDHVRARSDVYATTPNTPGQYWETQFVVYARTRGGAVSAVTEGSEVFVTY